MSNMKNYIGSKIIKATSMSSHEFKEFKGEPIRLPNGKTFKDEPGYKVIYPDGYISWSPKKAFKSAYREISEEEMNLLGE